MEQITDSRWNGEEKLPSDCPESIPVRVLQNYAYCPRLMYYQFVEKVFVENAATLSGDAVHASVNTPSSGNYPEDIVDPDRIVHRSLALESSVLGIHGVIDLVEKTDDGFSILDYKRGHPQVLPGNQFIAKEYDAVQIGAYALLMEEHGFHVQNAFIYYAATKARVPVVLNDTLFQQVRDIIGCVRKAVLSSVPEPLHNDSRCLYCSLYPVCLPEESLFWKYQYPPHLLKQPPDCDDLSGETVIVQDPKAYLSKRQETLSVTVEGKLVSSHPFRCIRNIILFGNIQFSTQVMVECLKRDIAVSLFSMAGSFIGRLDGGSISGLDSRHGQYKFAENEELSLSIARSMISAKIMNQRTFLMRNHPSADDTVLRSLASYRQKALKAKNRTELNGIEGQAASLYFSLFAGLIRNPDFQGIFSVRNRRPPRDPINALLSFGYSMLASELAGDCAAEGLDPSCGLLHVPRYGRPALALDLMEEFRPLIVDSIVISMINRHELAPSDFITASTGCNLNASGRKLFWNAYYRRMNTEIRHPLFKYSVTYRRMLILQVRQLWRIFRGESSKYYPLTPR